MSAPAEPLTLPRAARRAPYWRLLAIPAVLVVASVFALALDSAAAVAVLALLPVAVVLARPLLPPLFGPILFYDLVATARRGRYVIVRLAYVAALAVMLFLLYVEWFGKGGDVVGLFTTERIDRNQISAFNDSFFQMFMAVQYLVIVLLTPGITAGAVAEEKDRKTLEYLLATDLRNHEIVFGKLVSRLAYLTLILFTGLPVLSLLQLLGGVDPQMLLAGFVATAMTMLSLAGLSIFNSVYATKPRTAIILTYIQAAAYFGVTTCSLLLWSPGGLPRWAEWVCAGNPYVALKSLQAVVLRSAVPAAGGTLVSGLPDILLGYVVFHLAVTVVCLVGSLVGLRLWARWQASGRTRKAYVIALTQRRLPRVSARPMMWKELHAEPLIRLGEAAQIVLTTGVILFLLFAGFVLVSVILVSQVLGHLGERMNVTVRLMGTALASLMVLGTAVRAAGAISGERDRQTMDALLTTPIENDHIVWAKWWGGVLGVRKAGYCLLGLWAVGAVTGGLSVAAVPLLLLALFIYLGFAASLGLWFSLRCRTTLRATIWTLVTLLGVSLGPWLLTTFCCGPVGFLARPAPARGGPFSEPTPPLARLLSEVQTYALTPPVTMAALAFADGEVLALGGRRAEVWSRSYGGGDDLFETSPSRRLGFSMMGVLLYGIAAIVLLLLTAARFTAITGRLPLPGARPGRAPPRITPAGRKRRQA
jgi:ABC-type transport system involved in multi-copper enzyme maturation permease subunit